MKVLIIHNDLRVYWKSRLTYLQGLLKSRAIDLYAVELFGKGSPYSFDPLKRSLSWWDCLFPDKSFDQLNKHQIKNKIFNRLDEINPDVVIAGSIVFSAGAIGLRWAKGNRKKFIMFDDAKATDVKRNLLVQTVKKLITRQIDALWLPSIDYEAGYATLYNKSRIYFFYGYDCVDNEHFKFEGEKKFDNNKIIFVGRLVPIKNIENLLKAWQGVEKANNLYSLDIVGDGPLFPELKNAASALKLTKVTFSGTLDNEKVIQHLHEADAFVLPSWAESWGLVVNEAMAAGLPVLLSRKVNAAGTLLQERVNGYGFDPANVDELRQVLVHFINLPPAEKIKMSAESVKVVNQIGFDNMGRQLINALDHIASAPHKRPRPIASMAMRLWYGRYNTTGWDKAEDLNNKSLFRR